ncbi:AGAP012120-PA-like protein [Anopheles sinensis]|uniref:AGAP012120-PA-like protein n=1 Tax=Anopheles sinensis TaxID=74873 RepID=A0A084WM56_ANOSI|nr:AGAP012120-PA-like protein [Anopheles sinensis]
MASQDEPGPVLRLYPTATDILADRIYYCPMENCEVTFQNASHMQMHIKRHHKTTAPELNGMSKGSAKCEQNQFYCPSVECAYHQVPADVPIRARHFSSFKSLKQHYLKMHSERKFACSSCEKSFATASFLRHHRLSCGKKFQCEHCSYSYGSREALLTHAKRKQHGYSNLVGSRKYTKSMSIGTQTQIRRENQQTQTESSTSCDIPSTEVKQSECMPFMTIDQYKPNEGYSFVNGPSTGDFIYGQSQSGPIEGSESFVVCTETQTDFMDVVNPNVINHHDPLLSYTHMYTQTNDEPGLITDLGLSTIETQTSWNDGGEGFGDYLVSTETQTNFDIEGFNCGSHCNDKINQAVQCQQTNASTGTAFLSVMNDNLNIPSNSTQGS